MSGDVGMRRVEVNRWGSGDGGGLRGWRGSQGKLNRAGIGSMTWKPTSLNLRPAFPRFRLVGFQFLKGGNDLVSSLVSMRFHVSTLG